MEGRLLQDWITVRGQNDVTFVTQGADSWLDIGDAEDLTLFLDVREVSATPPKMLYETSPVEQASSFLAMVPSFATTVGQRMDRVFTDMAAVPPARFVRWTLKPGGIPWDITFRIWLATYARMR